MRITPETRKQRLVAELTEARSAILQAALALPPDAQDTPFLGVWSAHDIVAHLVGWDYVKSRPRWATGSRPRWAT